MLFQSGSQLRQKALDLSAGEDAGVGSRDPILLEKGVCTTGDCDELEVPPRFGKRQTHHRVGVDAVEERPRASSSLEAPA